MSSPWKLSFTVQDDKGRKSTHSLYYPADGVDVATVEAFVTDYTQKLDVLLEGAIVKISMQRALGLPAGIKTDPNPVADVEELLKTQIRTYPSFKKVTLTYPTYKDAYLLPPSGWDGLRKPTFDTEVTAFFHLLVVADTLGYPSNPVDQRGEPYDILLKRYQAFKGSKAKS